MTRTFLAGLSRLVFVLIGCEGNSDWEGILRGLGFQRVLFACDWVFACACVLARPSGPLGGPGGGPERVFMRVGLCSLLPLQKKNQPCVPPSLPDLDAPVPNGG